MQARKWIRRALTGALFLCTVLYAGACAYMFVMQRSLQYRPDPSRIAPAAAGAPMAEEIEIKSGDGETLIAWWIAPRDGQQPVYLYLHGNASNLARRAGRFLRMAQNGAGVLAVSWRGYSGSTGAPSEKGFHEDATVAYQWLNGRINAARIVLFGESIGSGVAVRLAAEKPARLLALDAPYDSTLAIAQARYPYLPVALLMLDQFRSDLVAPRVTIPVFIAHCRDDRTIPLASGQRLAALFKTQVQYEIYDSACHPAPYGRFMESLEKFLTQHGFPHP